MGLGCVRNMLLLQPVIMPALRQAHFLGSKLICFEVYLIGERNGISRFQVII